MFVLLSCYKQLVFLLFVCVRGTRSCRKFVFFYFTVVRKRQQQQPKLAHKRMTHSTELLCSASTSLLSQMRESTSEKYKRDILMSSVLMNDCHPHTISHLYACTNKVQFCLLSVFVMYVCVNRRAASFRMITQLFHTHIPAPCTIYRYYHMDKYTF